MQRIYSDNILSYNFQNVQNNQNNLNQQINYKNMYFPYSSISLNYNKNHLLLNSLHKNSSLGNNYFGNYNPQQQMYSNNYMMYNNNYYKNQNNLNQRKDFFPKVKISNNYMNSNKISNLYFANSDNSLSFNNLIVNNPQFNLNNIKDKKNNSNFTSSKSSKSNKIYLKYEIEEFNNFINCLNNPLIDHICTQKGAKEVIKFINKCKPECLTKLINLLNEKISDVMKNVYGNYFIQDFLKLCNKNHINLIYNLIQKNYLKIAKDYSGTHVLQSLLDYYNEKNTIQRALIINCFKDNVIQMALDNNATHVLQKILMTLPDQANIFLEYPLNEKIVDLCLDSNGICVIKKIIMLITPENGKKIIRIIEPHCIKIAENPFGNYVIQALLETYGLIFCEGIVKKILENFIDLSMQKFSSNITEKIILFNNMQIRNYILNKTFFDEINLLMLLKNKYGRFVLQKIIKILDSNIKNDIKMKISKLELTNNKDKIRIKKLLLFF